MTRIFSEGHTAISMEELIAQIKSEETQSQVDAFRTQWYSSLPVRHDALSRKLPHIIFGGTFLKRGKREYNGWIQLTVSNLKNTAEAERTKAVIASYPQTLFAMTGAIGHSVIFVLPYTRPDGTLPATDGEIEKFHAHAYCHAIKTFEPRLGLAITTKEPIPWHDCLMSYDPDVYYNPNALPIYIEQPSNMPDSSEYRKEAAMQPADNSGTNIYDQHRYCSVQYELALRQALEDNGDSLDRLDFKPLLVTIARLCFGAGIEEEECAKWSILYLEQFLGEVEIRQTISNVYGLENNFGTRPVVIPEQLLAMRIEEFMKRRYELRYNTMANTAEYRERNSFFFEFRPVTKRVRNSMAQNAELEGIKAYDKDIERYIESDRLPDYSPIEAYLKSLPKWDGKDRIRPLMRRVPCNNPMWEELSYRWFLSMVAHWQERDKEHGNALSPLLVGGQGCGKTTFCASLLPPQFKNYYADGIDFGKRRDAELYLTRFALINIDEFDQVSERHQGFLKHLIQKPTVNVKKPYSSLVESMKRYASFIGTSNHTDLLNDLSGSRRFICIEVTGRIANNQPIEYEQLYAQALAALDNGERYWLTGDEESAMMDENETFRQRPLHEDLFYRYYAPADTTESGTTMTAGEIYHSIQQKSGIRLPQSKTGHFGRFLKKIIPLQTNSKRGALYHVQEIF